MSTAGMDIATTFPRRRATRHSAAPPPVPFPRPRPMLRRIPLAFLGPLTGPVLVIGVAALGACHGSESAPARHTLIDSRDTYDPRSLDPALSTDVPTGRAVGYLFDGLTRFTPDAKVEPALALRWEVTPDGLTYTFHLRSGVTFHDGSPFTARNVINSWQRALDPKTKSGAAQFLFPIKGAKAFNADSAKTITGL